MPKLGSYTNVTLLFKTGLKQVGFENLNLWGKKSIRIKIFKKVYSVEQYHVFIDTLE